MKKILERDDTSSRTMVLCVSSVTVTENQDDNTAGKQTDNDGEKDGQGTTNKMEVTTCGLLCFAKYVMFSGIRNSGKLYH